MKRHKHPAADVVPARDLVRGQPQPRRELGATNVGEQVEHVQRAAQHPHGHDVGVGVVIEAGRR